MGDIKKKLIEVALPLEAINKEAAREKSIRYGHPSTLHVWWARRPLAACRAVLFASLVDDPSSHPERFPTEESQDKERQRLFRLIEELVKWENSTNERVLKAAREEIRKSTGGNPPPVLDPFCGGGSIPLEAQRLGLQAYCSDLNPVAVLVTKALIELPLKFYGRPPVNPESRTKLDHTKSWPGIQGIAEDVRYYGALIKRLAKQAIGQYFPTVRVGSGPSARDAAVIAWVWARTVRCPNPACSAEMPLTRSFLLATKPGKEAWIEPKCDRKKASVRFEVRTGSGKAPEGTVSRDGANCLFCGTAVAFEYIRSEGRAKRLGVKLMATAAEGNGGRHYLSPTEEHEKAAVVEVPEDVPDTDLPEQALGFRVQLYGMTKHRDLFTPRQLLVMTTFSNLISSTRERVIRDAEPVLGKLASTYADAVAIYLAIALDRMASQYSTLARWSSNPAHELVVSIFARQTLAMTWDFGEINPFCDAASWEKCVEFLCRVLEDHHPAAFGSGSVEQLDATMPGAYVQHNVLVCTDPPYYDNIGYADLSDYFYVWLRRALNRYLPNLFSTVLVPKAQELVATPFRFGGSRSDAQRFFERGLGDAFSHIRGCQHPNYPVSVFYAFKQAEQDEKADDEVTRVASTGWETMLEGLLKAGFTIDGTWPMRTERKGRMMSQKSNALASSVVLACRPRKADAPLTSRREFVAALKRELPASLRVLRHGNIAPVDLAQAAIGPGMAVFSRYSRVVEADGDSMSVRTALVLINQTLDEVLAEQEGEFDADTRWALTWFEQHGLFEGPFGDAETLSKAKDTSIAGMVQAGILAAKSGKVRLLKREELSADWDPLRDQRLTVWRIAQQLIVILEEHGEAKAAELFKKVGSLGDTARDLAYRLYNICDRKKWAQEANAYNSLVIAWPEIVKLAGTEPARRAAQGDLY
jgi:putative DNA methylase